MGAGRTEELGLEGTVGLTHSLALKEVRGGHRLAREETLETQLIQTHLEG